jgi:predicted RNase H-like nuclease (RuvC/YqgF family)
LDLFNKKKVIKLQQENKALKNTILEMSKQISYLKKESKQYKDENEELKFTLKNRRIY